MPRHRLALVARITALLLLAASLWLSRYSPMSSDDSLAVLVDDEVPAAGDDRETLLQRVTSDFEYVDIQRVAAAALPGVINRQLWQSPANTSTRFLIVSNGYWPDDMRTLATQLHTAGRTITWLRQRPTIDAPGIRHVNAPDFVASDRRARISVAVSSAASPRDVLLLVDGRPVDSAQPGATKTVTFEIPAPITGSAVYGVELRDAATGELLDRIDSAAAVNLLDRPEIWVVTAGPSVLAHSLREGGWKVSEIEPAVVAARLDQLSAVAAIVFDDIPASALSANAWSRIVARVREDALGLLVLGGPNSFGLGAYRGSTLESVLPVLSEPPADHEALSLMFLVDVSGSMDKSGIAGSRLAMARQAVTETAMALRPADRIGLMTFNVDGATVLPLAGRPDHVAAISEAWPAGAAGGTELSASLRRALDTLAAEPAGQKLLILLTDGFLADADLVAVEETLATSDVEVVALLIAGDEQSAEPALFEILAKHRSIGIRVDNILRLPDLTRSQLEARRPAFHEGRGPVSQINALPWLEPDVQLPDIDGYSLTRAKSEAVVYVASATGDPVIAGLQSGAGRTLVVTSGLSSRVPDWLAWDRWPAFAAGLVDFVAADSAAGRRIALDDVGFGDTLLSVELDDRGYDGPLDVSLTDDSGRVLTPELHPVAPGRYEAGLDDVIGDRFTAVLRSATAVHRQVVIRDQLGARELAETPLASRLVEEGIVAEFNGRLPVPARTYGGLARLLAVAAMLAFILALLVERDVPFSRVGRLAYWNRRWFRAGNGGRTR